MAQANSLSFDEVLAPAVQELETKYVADRGYELHQSWLKFRRIINHKKYANDLRAIFSGL